MKWIDIKQTDRRLRDCVENIDRIRDLRYSMCLDMMMIDTDLRILAQYTMLYSMHDDYISNHFK